MLFDTGRTRREDWNHGENVYQMVIKTLKLTYTYEINKTK